jgi:hypothetical protein
MDRKLGSAPFVTNIRFENIPKSRRIDIKYIGETISTEIRGYQSILLSSIAKSELIITCEETDFIFRIKLQLSGELERENLHVYLEGLDLIIETRNDSKGLTSSQTVDGKYIPIIERSTLFIRRAIHVPGAVNLNAISSRFLEDNVFVDFPKLCWMDVESED